MHYVKGKISGGRGATVSGEMETVLRKIPYFADLTKQEMHVLVTQVSKKHLQRGELLFSEGDSCAGLFMVVTGEIRLFNRSPGGREQVLAVRGPGHTFGDPVVFGEGNHSASASALDVAEVLFITREDFQNFCREHPKVMLKVIAEVGLRLRRLIRIIQDLSFTTVRHRLITLILQLAQTSGTASAEEVHMKLTETHEELAAELGTVRELVSRNLSHLQAEGFLKVSGRTIIVKDLAGLRREQTSSK
jgi:CRP/FNR family transcriptional regulator, cyclic AMP receptor protein